MKKFFCDITGKEVSQSDYVETSSHYGRSRHAYLADFGISGYDAQLEEQLSDMFTKCEEHVNSTRRSFIERKLAELSGKADKNRRNW